MRLWIFVAAVSAALAFASPAMACQPAHTPEEQAASMRALQADAWDKADLVFVARIEQRRTKPGSSPAGMVEVDLMPLTWLKGQAGPWQFGLADTGRAMCGPLPGFDAIRGLPGEEFVVFVKGDYADAGDR